MSQAKREYDEWLMSHLTDEDWAAIELQEYLETMRREWQETLERETPPAWLDDPNDELAPF